MNKKTEFFKIQQNNELNNYCFDCFDKNPNWVSINNAIYLCLSCAGKHRSLGINTSNVKSLSLDEITENQMKLLKIGGNERLKNFLIENKINKNSNIYNLAILDYYRKLLRNEAFNEQMPEKPINYYEIKDELKSKEEIDKINNENFICNKLENNNKKKKGFLNFLIRNGKIFGQKAVKMGLKVLDVNNANNIVNHKKIKKELEENKNDNLMSQNYLLLTNNQTHINKQTL